MRWEGEDQWLQDRLVVRSKEKQALRSSLKKLQAKQEAAVKEAAPCNFNHGHPGNQRTRD